MMNISKPMWKIVVVLGPKFLQLSADDIDMSAFCDAIASVLVG
jgi:hypothetical protein